MACCLLSINSPYGTSQQTRGSLHEAAFAGQEILRVTPADLKMQFLNQQLFALRTPKGYK